MAEVRMGRASGHDQIVVVENVVLQDEPVGREVEPGGFGENHVGVPLPPQDPADWRGDVPGREGRHRDLIQQRLKHVVVPPIDDRHLDRRPPERPRCIQTAESATDDNDTGHDR